MSCPCGCASTPIYIDPANDPRLRQALALPAAPEPAAVPEAERPVDPNDPATWSYFAHAFWYQADQNSWKALGEMAAATGQADVVQDMVRRRSVGGQ